MATIKVKLAVEMPRNRVLFVDAGSDFVDIFLSFLTLPLSAVHICAGASSPGCLSNLCDSVNRFRDSKLLKGEACHGLVLRPSHAQEFKFHYATFIKNQQSLQGDDSSCRCWEAMARMVHAYTQVTGTETFLTRKERFVITDDGVIKPASTSSMFALLQKFSADGIVPVFEELEVCVSWAEVVSLLKTCVHSDTVFTDVFLSKEIDGVCRRIPKPSIRPTVLRKSDKDSVSSPRCNIKLLFDGQEGKVLYAECKHEFVNLLFSFLTFPIGCMIKNLGGGTCHLGCSLDNLYSSAMDLDAAAYLTGLDFTRDTLLDPSIAPFKVEDNGSVQAVPVPEWYYMCKVPACQCRPPNRKCSVCDPEFVRDGTYIVDDELFVHQASAMSVMKHWCRRDRANFVEMDITVGKQEAVALLRAAFTSKTALTDVFGSRMDKKPPLLQPLPPCKMKNSSSYSLQQMQIFVKMPTGKTITLEVASIDTIDTVKAKIENKVEVPEGYRHELVYGGKYLKDSKTVADYSLVKECIVHCAFYMEGSCETITRVYQYTM
ncbi:uncharacterized protein LOC124696869 [Lolium rigidum]|uniref:uncharacterized protein LOC124696869 n=1 Tax=Lolium rigidum TaxID=89674 RepID=UPI001F5E20C4|nr:uncharacterized protein LOC124696869 [Lolium rigidum]